MRTPICFIATDIHFHDWREFSETVDGVNSRFKEALDSFDWFITLANSYGCKQLVFLGDIFHVKGIVRSPVFNPVFARFAEFDDYTIYMIPGNHDQFDRDGKIHALEPFKALKNVHVMEDYSGGSFGEFASTFVPYNRNQDWMESVIKLESEVPREHPKILFTHALINEVMVGEENFVLEGGISIPPEIANRFKFIISGDIHKRQRKGNIIYPGSLLAHSFNDAGDRRGCAALWWNDETNEIEYEEYDNPNSPFFMKIDLDVAGEGIHTLAQYVHTVGSPDRIYADIIGSEPVESVHDWMKEAPNFKYRYTKRSEDVKVLARSSLNLSSGPEASIEEYVRNSSTSLDKERLLKLGKEILSASSLKA